MTASANQTQVDKTNREEDRQEDDRVYDFVCEHRESQIASAR